MCIDWHHGPMVKWVNNNWTMHKPIEAWTDRKTDDASIGFYLRNPTDITLPRWAEDAARWGYKLPIGLLREQKGSKRMAYVWAVGRFPLPSHLGCCTESKSISPSFPFLDSLVLCQWWPWCSHLSESKASKSCGGGDMPRIKQEKNV